LLDRRQGRVLDVGCGNGDFLATLARRGWHVSGTDLSAVACDQARGKGIVTHEGPLTEANLPATDFDVITLWHVLEHLPDPTVELAEARRLLRDDGLLVLEVPNSGTPTFRLCGKDWVCLDVPRHLQHFTPPTLQQLLRQAGFAPVRRQNLHLWDFTYAYYSFMKRFGFFERLGIHYFSTDFSRASNMAKARFLLCALPIALLSLPYSVLTTLLTGNGETITITARKV
jgi:SAM-dependent methyltransferase